MSYTFLVIDDSSIVRKVLIRTIGMTDLAVDEVRQAVDGQDALQQLEQQPADLIFLDINMPVMNGMEFMEKLRTHERLKDTPVIVVSTEGSQERIDRLETLGISAYLRKPATPEEITETVRNVLGENS